MDFIRERINWFVVGAAALLASALFFTKPWDYVGSDEPELRVSSGTFSGSLDSVLKAEGMGDRERYAVTSALAKKLNLRRLRPEDQYEVFFSTWGSLVSISVTQGLRYYSVSEKPGGGYEVSVEEVELKSAFGKLSGVIKSSLWESMSAAGVPPAAILDFADIFSWSVDFLTEVRDGDRWALAWEYKTDPAGKVVSQKIKAAFYDGAGTGRKNAAAWKDSYYDEKGESLRSMFLRAPLHYRRISSHFTNRRFHPVLKYFRPHHGIDYAAPRGTPVSAVADGTVTFSGWKGGNGRLVMLKHGGGYVTTYGHLSRFSKSAKRGRRVAQGEVIGYVGSSGLSSGPHLDFRVKLNGTPLNFLKMKYRSSGGVSGTARASVAAAIKALGD
ncbi:MAG: peptidoglycan DD-metalloendopeptidase family protein [Elusimicrobiales bacterium]